MSRPWPGLGGGRDGDRLTADARVVRRLLDELVDLRKRDARCRRVEEGASRIAEEMQGLSDELDALGDDE